MSGSPPQIETIGALHSWAAPRQSSSGIMSLSEVEYSRIRPQPVQVRLQVCNGSSCNTVANFFVPRILWPTMYAAILVVSAKGNLIEAVRYRHHTECQPRDTNRHFRSVARTATLPNQNESEIVI